VSADSSPASFISRIAQREAVQPSKVTVFGGWPCCLDRFPEKGLCCGRVAMGTQQEFHGLARAVHGAIQVDPFAAQLDGLCPDGCEFPCCGRNYPLLSPTRVAVNRTSSGM
jgi:hypothetical protein